MKASPGKSFGNGVNIRSFTNRHNKELRENMISTTDRLRLKISNATPLPVTMNNITHKCVRRLNIKWKLDTHISGMLISENANAVGLVGASCMVKFTAELFMFSSFTFVLQKKQYDGDLK